METEKRAHEILRELHWEQLRELGFFTVQQIAEVRGCSQKAAHRFVRQLVRQGLARPVRFVRNPKTGRLCVLYAATALNG